MPRLTKHLELSRCPHCKVANPLLEAKSQLDTSATHNLYTRRWFVYACSYCGGLVTAWSTDFGYEVINYYPSNDEIDDLIPDRPREYLRQACESIHAPAGAIMLAASAVDSMLKLKGLKDGSLYSRIEKAVIDHLITKEMSAWAHDVRLDANDQRHADEAVDLPDESAAKRVIDFSMALAQFLFVLPARVERGIKEANTPAVG